MPEGLWDGETFVPLPPPSSEELQEVLVRMVKQLAKDFEGLEEEWPDGEVELLQLVRRLLAVLPPRYQHRGRVRHVALAASLP